MSISQEIIEKYHLNICTPEERKQVEEWLFNSETDILDEFTSPLDKNKLKTEIWAEIERFLPEDKKALKIRNNSYFMWKGAIAASFFIAIVTAILFCFFSAESKHLITSVSLTNSSTVDIKHVNAKDYDISVGPNTIANINNLSGVIDLSGSILISPKENVDLIFKGTKKKVTLKSGQTYIILKDGGDANGIIVVSERNLLDLPPALQKQITTQFDI